MSCVLTDCTDDSCALSYLTERTLVEERVCVFLSIKAFLSQRSLIGFVRVVFQCALIGLQLSAGEYETVSRNGYTCFDVNDVPYNELVLRNALFHPSTSDSARHKTHEGLPKNPFLSVLAHLFASGEQVDDKKDADENQHTNAFV